MLTACLLCRLLADERFCNRSWSECFNCKECVQTGVRPLAVPGRNKMTHLLLPFLHYFNVTALAKDLHCNLVGGDFPSYNAAWLMIRLLSRQTYRSDGNPLPLNRFENTWSVSRPPSVRVV